MTPALDHLILVARDPAHVAARLGALGLASTEGGEHAGQGTFNHIVPLGDCYLEIVGVRDGASSSLAIDVRRHLDEGSWMYGWVVRADIAEVETRTGAVTERMSRSGPAGHLAWSIIRRTGQPDGLPSVIAWDEGTQHPGATRAAQRLVSARVPYDPQALAAWLGTTDVDPVIHGSPTVTVDVGGREHVLDLAEACL